MRPPVVMADITPTRPSLPNRLAAAAVMGTVGMASRAFLYGLNKVEVTGLDNLLSTLDRRKQQGRERGLLTVCNHVAVYVLNSILRHWLGDANQRGQTRRPIDLGHPTSAIRL